MKNVLVNTEDASGNTLLHLAGTLAENTPINHIRGAALQMQSEVQWFKVSSIHPFIPAFLFC